jgi:hypothetical protein
MLPSSSPESKNIFFRLFPHPQNLVSKLQNHSIKNNRRGKSGCGSSGLVAQEGTKKKTQSERKSQTRLGRTVFFALLQKTPQVLVFNQQCFAE